MKQIGITGGIGSGKSLVCKIFKVLGIPVYDADSRAKALYLEDHTLKDEVINLLGKESYHLDGRLNTVYISSKVFQDKILLDQLNALVHPLVKSDYTDWLSRQISSNPSYVLREAALLYEANTEKGLDGVIVVQAPESLRLARVLKRDPQRTEEEVKNIMAKQWPEDRKRALASFVIYNDEQQLLIPQILQIDKQIRA